MAQQGTEVGVAADLREGRETCAHRTAQTLGVLSVCVSAGETDIIKLTNVSIQFDVAVSPITGEDRTACIELVTLA